MNTERLKTGSLYDRRLFFTVIFFSAIIFSFMAGYFMPAALDDHLRGLTSSGAIFLARLFGLDAFIEPHHIISIEGKRLSIVSECSAIGYIFIFVSAVMAFPSSFSKKISGLLLGVPLIIFLNLFRIVTLGWTGGHFPSYFDLAHTVLWEGGFVVITFLVWAGWLKGLFELRIFRLNVLSGLFLKRDFQIRLLSLLVILSLFLAFYYEDYQKFIALWAERLIYTVGYEGVVVRADGSVFVIAFSRNHFKEFWAGSCYMLPFIVLVLLFPRIGMNGKEEIVPQRETIFKLISGSVLMTVFQIISVFLFFVLVKEGKSGWPLATVDAIARLSPAMVWLALAYCWRPMPEGTFH